MNKENTNYEIVNDKNFDKTKEDYCPQCYFEDDKMILRSDCKHNKENTNYIEEVLKDFSRIWGEKACPFCDKDVKDCDCPETESLLHQIKLFIRQALEKLEAEKNDVIDQLVEERETLARGIDIQREEFFEDLDIQREEFVEELEKINQKIEEQPFKMFRDITLKTIIETNNRLINKYKSN